MSSQLMETIVLTASYYGHNISEPVLKMYVDDLSDLDPMLCCAAYETYRKNPKNRNFPLPAQIREIVDPVSSISPEAKAAEVAARIIGSVGKFGWAQGANAKAYIGDVGWKIVERQGGWNFICQNMGVSISQTTLQAQLRQQLEGAFKYGLGAMEEAVGALPEGTVRTGELVSLADHVKKLIPGGGPEDAA